MTLVLSCVTGDYALQVSDRRLTDLNSGRIVAEEANKAVLLSNRAALAYTGLARIEGKPADIWLRDTLAPFQSIPHAIELLADEATRAFAAMHGAAANKRQAFIVAGWGVFPDHGEDLRPFGLTVSNAIDEQGSWLPGALPEFSGRGKILRPPRWGCVWTHAGGLPPDRGIAMDREIRRFVKRGLSAASMAELLAREIRLSADRDARVGRGLMINSIPKAATETDDLLALSSMPTESTLSFAHLRHDDTVEAVEGPHVVRPGGRAFSNFKHWREDDADVVQVDIKMGSG